MFTRSILQVNSLLEKLIIYRLCCQLCKYCAIIIIIINIVIIVIIIIIC